MKWKQEFPQYQERIQQWDYYYQKYLLLLEKTNQKLFNSIN